MKPLKALISKNTIHRAHTGNMYEIKNFTYKDIITPGNILMLHGGTFNTHHAIVVDNKCGRQFFKDFTHQSIPALTLNIDSKITYWGLDKLDKDDFKNLYGTVIYKVFKTNIDIKNIKSVKDLEKLYTEYNLIKLTV